MARERLYLFDTTLRDELAAMDVVIKVSQDGTTWEVAR